MFRVRWFELIQPRILITTEVYVRVMPAISRFPVSNVYLSASRPLLVLLPWLLLVLSLLCSHLIFYGAHINYNICLYRATEQQK